MISNALLFRVRCAVTSGLRFARLRREKIAYIKLGSCQLKRAFCSNPHSQQRLDAVPLVRPSDAKSVTESRTRNVTSINKVWTVTVRDRLMVARPFLYANPHRQSDKLAVGSSRPRTAGSTLLVDATFVGSRLVENANFVLDIGLALSSLSRVLGKYAYRDIGDIMQQRSVSMEAFAQRLWIDMLDVLQKEMGASLPIDRLEISLLEPATAHCVTYESAVNEASVASMSVCIDQASKLIPHFDNPIGVKLTSVWNNELSIDLEQLENIIRQSPPMASRESILNRLADMWQSIASSIEEMRAPSISDHLNVSWGALAIAGTQSSDRTVSLSHYRALRVTHSFSGDCFGPAQGVHGTSFAVEIKLNLPYVSIIRDCNLSRLQSALEANSETVLARFDSIDLDHHPDFLGRNTTCEYLAEHFIDEIAHRLQLELPIQTPVQAALTLSIKESDVAGVSCQRELPLSTAPASLMSPEIEIVRNPFNAILIFDLDNCLFHNDVVHRRLVSRIHEVCNSRYGLSREDCDRLHSDHGSTISGLVVEAPSCFTARFGPEGVHKELRVLYEQIYTDVQLFSRVGSFRSEDHAFHRKDLNLVDLMCALPNTLKIICSNSHSTYVERALSSMGFCSVNRTFDYIITPDRIPELPSKVEPKYWEFVCQKLTACKVPTDRDTRILFFDDCQRNLAAAEKYFSSVESNFCIDTVPVNPSAGSIGFEKTFVESLVGVPLQMDRIQYLRGIARLNQEALNQHILERLEQELASRFHGKRSKSSIDANMVVVLDVGCGLCPMLPFVTRCIKRALRLDSNAIPELVYLGIERESVVRDETMGDLQNTYELKLDKHVENSLALSRLSGTVEGVRTHVALHSGDLMEMDAQSIEKILPCSSHGHGVDLVVASCFVDLFQPTLLATQLSRLAPGALLWAPICCSDDMRFEGKLPQQEFEDAMESYIRWLKDDENQHLCLSTLRENFSQVGIKFLAEDIDCKSDWRICLESHPEVYRSLVKFLAAGVVPDLIRRKNLEAAGWVLKLAEKSVANDKRMQEELPAIFTHNVDLLASLPHAESEHLAMSKPTQSLVFAAPQTVKVIEQAREGGSDQLRPDAVELESLYSAVSSGTELRLFENKFGENEVIDEIFDSESCFGYPMSYGYQTIGVVKRMGLDVPLDLAGKTVFGFLPHRSRHIVEDFRQLIPIHESLGSNGHITAPTLDPRNFCFLPAHETALNLVHDSDVKIGDKVCVVGQGLIGNITAAILLLSGAQVMVVDIVGNRLRSAERFAQSLGASFSNNFSSTSSPQNERAMFATFDTCIELSGSSTGLQCCLNYARYGGKIVVGSWSSSKSDSHSDALNLHLDTKFHRAKIQIVSSQVSQIAGRFSDTWNKERRLQKAMDLVRRIKPYDVLRGLKDIGVAEMPLSRAQIGYEFLRDRKVSAVVFNYGKCETEHTNTTTIVRPELFIEVDDKVGNEKQLEFLSKCCLATKFCEFDLQVWRYGVPSSAHYPKSSDNLPFIVLMTRGKIGPQTRRLTLRLHDGCITSEAFGSLMCDCRQQMELAQKRLSEFESTPDSAAMILYTFQEGRGIGLPAKIAAYNLQREQGLDTLDANLALGCPADARDYSFVKELFFSASTGLAMTQDKLEVELLSNNPRKVEKLEENGVKISKVVPLVSNDTVQICKETGARTILTDCHAGRYLDAKVKRMGHKIYSNDEVTLPALEDVEASLNRCQQLSAATYDRKQQLTADLQPLIPLLEVWSQKYKDYSRRHVTIESSKPFVTLSYASGLDGCIGKKSDIEDRLVISGPQSNVLTHVLRCCHDAILVGVGTVIADNPRLSARLFEAVNSVGTPNDAQIIIENLESLGLIEGRSEREAPIPVIIDGSLRTPLDCRLIQNATKSRPVIIVTSSTAAPGHVSAMRAQTGVEVLIQDPEVDKLCLEECFRNLKQKYDIRSIMVEGGANVIDQLLRKQGQLVDLHILTMAPRYSQEIEARDKNGLKGGIVNISSNARLFPLHPAMQFGDDIVLMSSLSP